MLCYAMRDLIPLVQFKKREKWQWRSVTLSKVADLSYDYCIVVRP